jgi:VWFA-related protein
MSAMRFLVVGLAALALGAQQPPAPPRRQPGELPPVEQRGTEPAQSRPQPGQLAPERQADRELVGEELPERTFRETVDIVVAPTLVVDSQGQFVHGLKPSDFRLYDNKKLQNISVDVSFVPMSVVVAVQASTNVEEILPKIRNVGTMLQPLVTGEQGEVAIISFDHRLQTVQNFTSDGERIKEAIGKIKAGSTSSRQVDAVIQAVRMLRNRPQTRRRIIVLFSETRGNGNEGSVRDALTDAQMHNVIIYPINISRLLTTLTGKPQPPRPDPFPSTARHAPAGGTMTPTEAQQNRGYGDAIPVFVEIFKGAKSIFVDNPSEVFSKYTGGREYSFKSTHDLEAVVQQLGDELHSHYLLSYRPNNKTEGGFHEIEVQIAGRPDLKVRTRPGYWIAAVPE